MTGKDKDTVPGKYHRLTLSGRFDLKIRYPDGTVDRRSGKNLITNTGESLVAQLLDPNGSESPPEYLAFGSGTEGALKTDAALQTEITAEPRIQPDSTVQNSNTIQFIYELTATSGYTVEEIGVFNAATIGTMISRFLTQPLAVSIGSVIDITWTLTISGVD